MTFQSYLRAKNGMAASDTGFRPGINTRKAERITHEQRMLCINNTSFKVGGLLVNISGFYNPWVEYIIFCMQSGSFSRVKSRSSEQCE